MTSFVLSTGIQEGKERRNDETRRLHNAVLVVCAHWVIEAFCILQVNQLDPSRVEIQIP